MTAAQGTWRRAALAVLVGFAAGVVVLGGGGRLAMRVIALATGQTPVFSASATLEVLVAGAWRGALGGVVYLGVERALPERGLWRGAGTGLLLFAVAVLTLRSSLRELPAALDVVPLATVLFGFVFLLYGITVQLGIAYLGRPSPSAVAALRSELVQRIGRLRPEATPRWGRMTASEMICHLGDQLRLALGDLDARPIRTPFLYTPLKQFAIYAMPWPKAKIRAPREARSTRPDAWDADLGALRTLLDRFAARDPVAPWPPHPYFGTMSGRLWVDFTRRHFDHHLRQFGV